MAGHSSSGPLSSLRRPFAQAGEQRSVPDVPLRFVSDVGPQVFEEESTVGIGGETVAETERGAPVVRREPLKPGVALPFQGEKQR